MFLFIFLLLILLTGSIRHVSQESIGLLEESLTFLLVPDAAHLSHFLFERVYLTSVIVLAHSGGHIIQGRRLIFGRGFLIARRITVGAEFVEVHPDNIFAVFGCTTLLLLALLLLVMSGRLPGATDTMTSE